MLSLSTPVATRVLPAMASPSSPTEGSDYIGVESFKDTKLVVPSIPKTTLALLLTLSQASLVATRYWLSFEAWLFA